MKVSITNWLRTSKASIFLGLFVALGTAGRASDALDFKEVFEVLRTNLSGVDEQELNRAAARGLIAQLRPRVMLLSEQQFTNATSTNLHSFRSRVFDKSFGYVRFGQISTRSDKQFADALDRFSSNRLKGLVLDLRFSGGEDYSAAADIADRFVAAEQPLIDYGEGLKKSSAKDNAIKVPVAILVNAKTIEASEALAGVLRHHEVGLLIGSDTGGQASIAKTVTLSTGQALRIATTPVKTGNGHPLPISGLKADIAVEVDPDVELVHVKGGPEKENGMARLGSSAASNETAAATNRLPRRRINEAELVRMLRDGIEPERGARSESGEERPLPPAVQDPVLARALDLLKGLAVVQQTRSL